MSPEATTLFPFPRDEDPAAPTAWLTHIRGVETRIPMPLQDTDDGSREGDVLDPESHLGGLGSSAAFAVPASGGKRLGRAARSAGIAAPWRRTIGVEDLAIARPPAAAQSSFLPPDPPEVERLEDDPQAPLAARMRPRTLDEFEGHGAIIGEGTVLRRAIEADRLPSLILWGPPGSGKTTLARILARMTRAEFVALSAVTSGVADVRAALAEARARRRLGRRTMLFIDEIHRFNKAQQDAILPHVESGLVCLVGATTENPAFEVNAALLSRCRVFRLEALDDAAVDRIVSRALADPQRGLGAEAIDLALEARRFLVAQAGGDARVALTALELAVAATSPGPDGVRRVGLDAIRGALQHRALRYDKDGDQHYDIISALIKSIRASDPDAAVYWLARLLEAGEDPLFVARRLVILAAEDVGLADPHALPLAVAAQQAAHFVGMPEGYLPLTEAVLYLAAAPKSNSTIRAYSAARADVLATLDHPVPLHLRNAPTALAKALGHGQGYRYAHAEAAPNPRDPARPPDEALQENLPEALAGRRYFEPSAIGAEASIRHWIDRRRAGR